MQPNELVIFNRVMDNVNPLIDEKIEDKTEYKTTLKANKIKNWIIGLIGAVIVSIIGGAVFIGKLIAHSETQSKKLDEFIIEQKLLNAKRDEELKSVYNYIDAKLDPIEQKQQQIFTNQAIIGIQLERMDPQFKASNIVTRGSVANSND